MITGQILSFLSGDTEQMVFQDVWCPWLEFDIQDVRNMKIFFNYVTHTEIRLKIESEHKSQPSKSKPDNTHQIITISVN